jgi:hypothetical protein
MAVLDTAIQENPKHLNPGLDSRVKPGYDKRERFRFFHTLTSGNRVNAGRVNRLLSARVTASPSAPGRRYKTIKPLPFGMRRATDS